MTTGNLYVYDASNVYLVVEDHGETHDLWWLDRDELYIEITKPPCGDFNRLTPEEWK